ncbi:uncharacterized protein [Antedon mediterranea]|uniref:uncharacterized protein n=1 Tax=Antedon mediterranea TaxID=105859 RepID=UPI003AF7841C
MAMLISKRSLETSLKNDSAIELSRNQVRSTSNTQHAKRRRIEKQNFMKLRRVSSMRRRQLRAAGISSQDQGQLKIMINCDNYAIFVNIIAARKLMFSEKRVCNPYVKVLLRNYDQENGCIWKRTKTIENNRNPRFNEQFTFALKETPRNGRIIISVFNRFGTRNEFLGCMSFGTKSLLFKQKEVGGWYRLLDQDLGRIKHHPVAMQSNRSHLYSSSKVKPKFLTVERGEDGRYGFTLLDSLPVRVNTIVPGGPAEKVGLECNDLFLELNGFNVVGSSGKTIVDLIAQAPGKLCLLVQPYANITENLMTLSTQTLSVTPALSVRRLTMAPTHLHTPKESLPDTRNVQELNKTNVHIGEIEKQSLFKHPSSLYIKKLHPNSKKQCQFVPSLTLDKVCPSVNPPSLPINKNAIPNLPSTSVQPFQSSLESVRMTSSLKSAFEDVEEKTNFVNNSSSNLLPMMQSSPTDEPNGLNYVSCMSPELIDGHDNSILCDSSFISTSSLSDESFEKHDSMYEEMLLEKLEATGVADTASVFSLPFFQKKSPVVPKPKTPLKPKVFEMPIKAENICKPPRKFKISEKPKIPEKPKKVKHVNMNKPKIPEKPKHLIKQQNNSIQQVKDPWQKISTQEKRKHVDPEENIPQPKKMCYSVKIPHLNNPHLRLETMHKFTLSQNDSIDNTPSNKLGFCSDGKYVISKDSISLEESSLRDLSATPPVDTSLSIKHEVLQEKEAVCIVDMLHNVAGDIKPGMKDLQSRQNVDKKYIEDELSNENKLIQTSKTNADYSQESPVVNDVGDSDGCVCQCVSIMSGESSRQLNTKQTIVLGGIQRDIVFYKKVEPFIVDVAERDFIHAGKLFLRKKVNKVQEVFGILFSDMLIFAKQVISSNKIKVMFPPICFSEVSIMEFNTRRATEFNILMVTSEHPATLKYNKIVLGAPTSRIKKVWQFLLQQYVLEFKIGTLQGNGVQHLHTDIKIDGDAMESNNNRAGLLSSSSKANNGDLVNRTCTAGFVPTFESTNESGTQSNMLSSTNRCECDNIPAAMNQTSVALRSNRSFPYLRNAVSSAPSSPINKVVTNSHSMLERQQSSPTDMMLADENNMKKGKRKTSIFKRFSGKNKEEVSGKTPKEKATKEKKPVNHASRRAMSVGDERMLHGVENNIPTLEEGEELAGQSFQRHSVVSDKPVRKSSRNLAKDLKDKVRSLRRRHTDSALRDTEKLKPPLPPCTLQEVKQWSDSFDRLLRDKCGLEAFRQFLQTEFSDENIEFWLACEEYRMLSPSKHTNRARKIHEDFVATQAPREVNLDSATRIETTSNVRKADEHTFDNAQKRIEALMEKDSYPRFLKSDIYQQLLRTSKKAEC